MPLRFAKPTVQAVRRIITEVAYTGTYVYGRKHWLRDRAGGEPVPVHRAIGQYVERQNHHEAYVSLEEYEENLRILGLNRKGPKHSQLGPGPALLQGLCRCRLHGLVLNVHYTDRARRRHWSLRCQGDYLYGGEQCHSLPGLQLEALVVDAALARLEPGVVDEARRVWTAERRDWKRANAGVSADVRRQEELVERLRRRIVEDDGTRAHLRDMLDDEYERAAKQLATLRGRAAKQEDVPDPFTPARWDELSRLCEDRSAIWRAPTTTDQDRKQLLRILIHQVVVEQVEAERITASVEWADGAPATTVEILKTPYFHRLIWRWHCDGLALEEMARRLQDMGARTQQGRPWSISTLQRTVAILFARARESGEAKGVAAPSAKQRAHDVMTVLAATGHGPDEIAERLNAAGLFTRFGNPWSEASVRRTIKEKRHGRAPG